MCLFGEIVDAEMRLNDAGRMAQQCWCEIPAHFPNVELDEFVVMPNHVHGIIVITLCGRHTDIARVTDANMVGAQHAVPLPSPKSEHFQKPVAGSIPTIIRSFKSAVAKRINEWRGTLGAPVWQRNYYEHIVRDDESLNRIREYIASNPMQWECDRENAPATHTLSRPKAEPWRI
jgi:REP element-mobilizing transposase RayT